MPALKHGDEEVAQVRGPDLTPPVSERREIVRACDALISTWYLAKRTTLLRVLLIELSADCKTTIPPSSFNSTRILASISYAWLRSLGSSIFFRSWRPYHRHYKMVTRSTFPSSTRPHGVLRICTIILGGAIPISQSTSTAMMPRPKKSRTISEGELSIHYLLRLKFGKTSLLLLVVCLFLHSFSFSFSHRCMRSSPAVASYKTHTHDKCNSALPLDLLSYS